MRNTSLEQRRFTSRAATASPSVEHASPARRGQPGTPCVTTRGDAVATKGSGRASSRSGSARSLVCDPDHSCAAPVVHSRIGEVGRNRVNSPKSGVQACLAKLRSSHHSITSGGADSLATIPVRYVCVRSASRNASQGSPPHVASKYGKPDTSVVASSVGIVVCLFTAVTGGLPIKWVLQLLGAIQ